MIKETVEYVDFDDKPQTMDLHFHLSKTELLDHIYLKDELTSLQDDLEKADGDDISTENVVKVVQLVKKLVKLSYGSRSDDGKRFIKNDAVWEEFAYSAAYDAFVYSLFEQPNRAISFLTNLIPKDIREEVEKSIEAASVDTTDEDIEALRNRLRMLESE